MTDDAPAPELVTATTFDSARLIAEVRRGDAAARAEAYRRTFGSELGRFVLLDGLARIGQFGTIRGDALSGEARAYHDGSSDALLEQAKLAGFDAYALSAALMTNLMEQDEHDRYDRYGHDRHGDGPRVVFDDDAGSDGGGRSGGGLDGQGQGGGQDDEPEF